MSDIGIMCSNCMWRKDRICLINGQMADMNAPKCPTHNMPMEKLVKYLVALP